MTPTVTTYSGGRENQQLASLVLKQKMYIVYRFNFAVVRFADGIIYLSCLSGVPIGDDGGVCSAGYRLKMPSVSWCYIDGRRYAYFHNIMKR